MDSSIASEIQLHASHLLGLLKENHSFLFNTDYKILMTLLYEVVDKSEDFIDL